MGEIGSFSDFDLSGDPPTLPRFAWWARSWSRGGRGLVGPPLYGDYGCRGQIESRVAGAGSHGNSRHGSKVV